MSRQEFAKKYELPKKDRFTVVGNLRPMEEKDAKEVGRLLREQNEKFGIHTIYSKAEILHWFMTREGVVHTYVVENPEKKGSLTDFMSFTIFHQHVLNGKELGHNYVMDDEATFFYYAFTKNTYMDMIKAALWLAKDELKVDSLAINIVQEHDAETLEKELKFLPDNQAFNYYLTNYSLGEREIRPSDVGIVFP